MGRQDGGRADMMLVYVALFCARGESWAVLAMGLVMC